MQDVSLSRTTRTEHREAPPDRRLGELVAHAKQGDREAFALLYRRHVALVYDFAARRLPDAHAAEEATQEVFSRAFRGLAGCRNEAMFAGWLFGIARYVIADVYRDRRQAAETLEAAGDPEDPDPLPVEHVLRAEQRDELLAARERCLSPSEREIFDLLLAGLTDKEIAAALGRRHGAIRTAHWRLLTTLRNCFGVPPRGQGVRHGDS